MTTLYYLEHMDNITYFDTILKYYQSIENNKCTGIYMTSPHVSYFQPFYLEAGKRRKTSRKTFLQTSFVEHRKWQKDQSKYSN